MPALQDLLFFVTIDATEDDLDVLLEAARARRTVLAMAAATAVTTGGTVRIVNIDSGYLEGLQGSVTEITPATRRRQGYVTILLDEDSTAQLRRARPRALATLLLAAAPTSDRIEIPGIPLLCCRPV